MHCQRKTLMWSTSSISTSVNDSEDLNKIKSETLGMHVGVAWDNSHWTVSFEI